MKFRNLPQHLRVTVESLKHGSNTIECDVQCALEDAKNLKDFQERVSGAMDNLIGEALDVKLGIGGKKNEVHVVIHLHRGVIFNTAVFGEEDKAKQYRDEEIKEHYGELVETQEGDDVIDLQTCEVIV